MTKNSAMTSANWCLLKRRMLMLGESSSWYIFWTDASLYAPWWVAVWFIHLITIIKLLGYMHCSSFSGLTRPVIIQIPKICLFLFIRPFTGWMPYVFYFYPIRLIFPPNSHFLNSLFYFIAVFGLRFYDLKNELLDPMAKNNLLDSVHVLPSVCASVFWIVNA